MAIHTRAVYLASAFALLFFLGASAPHRVHHFFETALPPQTHAAHSHSHHHETDHAHEHDHNHGQKPAAPSSQPDCVVLAAAQQSHAAAVHSFAITLVQTAVARAEARPELSISLCELSPRSQRAPPLAS